jgi:hypothetical protein
VSPIKVKSVLRCSPPWPHHKIESRKKKLAKNSVPASFEVIWEFHNRNQSSGAVLFFKFKFPKSGKFFSPKFIKKIIQVILKQNFTKIE